MRFLSVVLVALLAGCSSAPKTISDEQRMEITENYQGLQENYRERLQKNPQDHPAAVKLARVYFKAGDLEAATYYLDQIPDETCSTLDGCWLARADIAYANEDYDNAKYCIDYSLAVQKDVYAVKNLYGIIMATEGDFETAKRYFFEARLGFKDENAIRNNLAMTEMMEGRYAEAAERLMPLYKNGTTDPTIRANLIVSLMRSKQEHVVKQMLLQENSEEQALLMFAQLKDDLHTWPDVSGQAPTDEEI